MTGQHIFICRPLQKLDSKTGNPSDIARSQIYQRSETTVQIQVFFLGIKKTELESIGRQESYYLDEYIKVTYLESVHIKDSWQIMNL